MKKYMGKVSAVFLLFLMTIFWTATISYNLRAVLSTKVSAYTNLVVSAAGAETDLIAATGYSVGVPVPGGTLGPFDLRAHSSARGGSAMEANSAVFTCFATCNENDDVTISIYGISDGGAPERIGSLLLTFGTAIRSSGVRWADTCVATDTHITTIIVSDSGNNRIVKVTLDTTGYRYMYAIAHTTTTGAATGITVPLRYF